MKKPSKKQQVLSILKREGSISNFHCIDTRLTTRLPAIIMLLREDKYNITTKILKNKDCVYTLHRKVVARYRVPALNLDLPVYSK